MYGNVEEWCQEIRVQPKKGLLARSQESETDPTDKRVIRGGSITLIDKGSSEAHLYGAEPTARASLIGFRVVRVQSNKRANEKAKTQQNENVTTQSAPVRLNSIGMSFKPLRGGTFTMWTGLAHHPVTLTKPFEIGVYEVTQAEFEKVMGTNPSSGTKNASYPVNKVNWDDAIEFCS